MPALQKPCSASFGSLRTFSRLRTSLLGSLCLSYKRSPAIQYSSLAGDQVMKSMADSIKSSISEADKALYGPLRPWQTRVIELEPGEISTPLICRLHVSDVILFEGVALHHLQKRIEYDASSYCWGTGPAHDVIWCNAHELKISSTLAAALRSFRSSLLQPPRFIWVDAICINQEDPEEKARQVQIMLSIFRKAKSVLVWLDDAHDLDQKGFNFLIQTERDGQKMLLPLPQRDTSVQQRMMQTVRTLCQRPWFRRTWVRQEYCAARAVVFVCNGKVIASDRFEMLARKLPGAADARDDTELESAGSKSRFEAAFDAIWPGPAADKSNIGFMFLENERGRGKSKNILPVMTGLDMFRFVRSSLFFDATNLVDKMYGLVGILGLEQSLMTYSHNSPETWPSCRCR
jgi:Heterokaryon incompatibility protein (HET)